MALITDPDNLTDAAPAAGTTEIEIDPATLTIKLNNNVGNLSDDGVTLKCIYSFCKEEWKDDPLTKILAAYPFPFIPITDEFFELVEGWTWADTTTEGLIRSAGWLVRNTGGNTIEHWAGIQAIGNIFGTDQLYYDQGVGATNFLLTGAVNQAIQIRDDPNGDGNYVDGYDRSSIFTIFNREEAQAFASATLADIGVSDLLAPKVFSFAVGTGNDLKVTTADTVIDPNADGSAADGPAPYNGMTITYIDHQNRGAWTISTVYAANDVVQSGTDGRWYITAAGGTSAGDDTNLAGGSDTGVTWVAYTGERQIGTNWYSFGVIIDGNAGTAEEIYEFVQFRLRQNVDIDDGAGTVTGNTADALLEFVGDNLGTLRQSNNWGVYIDNFLAADTNRISFVDDLGATQTFPFVAVLTISFNSNLVTDGVNARYWVFYTDPTGGAGDEWGTAGAIIVDDNSDVDMTGTVPGASVQHDYDYDGNVQGGRTAGTDAAITVVAIGLSTAQYVRATGTIARSTANAVSLVAALERQYENV